LEQEVSLRQRGIWLLKPCTRKLIGFLSHKDSRLRGEGAKALGKIADQESVEPLIEALLREKQDEQMPMALAEIGDPSSLEPLLTAFKEAEREVRPNIALALGAFKDRRAVDALIEALSELDPNVRFNSITSLGKLKDSSAVSSLLGCLGETNEWIFLNVVDALARLGSHKATNPLVAFYLKERNERKRSAIITALGSLADLTSVPTLTKALRDTDDRVKANAIESLGQLDLPAEKVMSLIQPFLKHPNNRVRGNAMVLAGNLGRIDLIPYFRMMQDDPEKWIRATLGYVLSVVDHSSALEIIIDLLKDEDADVRKNAALALSQRASGAQTELLVKMLSDSIPFVRLQAVITLGRLKIVSAVPWLVKMLKTDRNFKIRSAVITSLGHIGDKSGIPTLQGALRDRDSRVRANAVEAVEEVLGEASIPVLRPLLSDPDNRTRSNVTKALFRQGDFEVIHDLEKMLGGKEASTRVSGAYAVGQIGLALKEIETSPLQDPLKSALEKVAPPKGYVAQKSEVAATPEPQQKVVLPENKEEMRKVFVEHAKQGRLKQSLEVALQYIKKYPHDLMANFFIANLNFQLSRFEDSIQSFLKVIEQDPFHIQAHSNLGVAFYRSGKLFEAIEYFKKTLKLKPDLSVIRFNLASLYIKTNKWEEAIRQFEEGLRYAKPTAKVLTNLAFACQKTGNFEKALDCYKKAASLDPTDAGNYYSWAIVLARTGRKTEARVLINKALRELPAGSPGIKNLRDLLERLAG
jgi:HEAT repeat protein/Flp pilus assembly protein TadD